MQRDLKEGLKSVKLHIEIFYCNLTSLIIIVLIKSRFVKEYICTTGQCLPGNY